MWSNGSGRRDEFVDAPDDTGDLTSVPPTTAVFDHVLTTGDATLGTRTGKATAGVQGNGTAPAPAGDARSPAPDVIAASAPASPPATRPARKAGTARSSDRVSSRDPIDPTPVDNGYTGGDRFTGPGADPCTPT